MPGGGRVTGIRVTGIQVALGLLGTLALALTVTLVLGPILGAVLILALPLSLGVGVIDRLNRLGPLPAQLAHVVSSPSARRMVCAAR